MRIMFVLRGAPGCGKSTFIQKHNLERYTLCADTLREMFASDEMDDKNACMTISQKNDKDVWLTYFKILEGKMSRGEFCVLDATHSKPKDFTRYKTLMSRYGYRAYCISFDDVSLETCKAQNHMRKKRKWVPEEVIEAMHKNVTELEPPPQFQKINHNDDAKIDEILNRYQEVMDADQYKKIVVFGDIHGCWQPLSEYLDANPISDDTLYIFTGDYIDRGIQNAEVVKWLMENFQRKNVILLEGNHERWLMEYARGCYDAEIKKGAQDNCLSPEFFNETIPQIAMYRNKPKFMELCESFKLFCYLRFDGKRYFINHGGVGFLPEKFVFISAQDLLRGKYEDPVDEWFENNELAKNPDLIQIHAHRNTLKVPMKASANSYNLCEDIEFGGNLRILEISKG